MDLNRFANYLQLFTDFQKKRKAKMKQTGRQTAEANKNIEIGENQRKQTKAMENQGSQ